MNTIFALSTPPGKSGVAIIRISGEAAFVSLKSLGIAKQPVARLATRATLYAEQQLLDDALVLTFPAPHSFTGEDVVEYHIHGSQAVIKGLLEQLSALPDCRLAEPGEFTRRAFLNGKMDLTAAEGLADLIDAQTQAQHRQAMRFMKGEAAQFYESLRSGIVHALAYLEAFIDFPDEEIPPHVVEEIRSEVERVVAQITAQLAGKAIGEKIRDGIRVVILGAPNVGKSSLMNLLAGRDVAIVSALAGTTRDVIEVELDIKGYRVILTDTAGIREHGDAIEEEGIRRSHAQAHEADVRLVMLDAQQIVNDTWPPDSFIQPYLEGRSGVPTLLLANKTEFLSDKPLPHYGSLAPLAISVKTQRGIDGFMRELETHIAALNPPELSFITRSRHRHHLQQALVHLQNYNKAGLALELAAEELRRAAVEIGKITGHISVEELLGHIFSSFCIGK